MSGAAPPIIDVTQAEADNLLASLEMAMRSQYPGRKGNWLLVWGVPGERILKIASSVKDKETAEDRQSEAIIMIISALAHMWQTTPTMRGTTTPTAKQ